MNVLFSLNKHEWLMLIVMQLICLLLCWACIHEGHDWGGDFALYIEQSDPLIHSRVPELYLQNKITVDRSVYNTGPYLYPYGFPVLLSPVYYFFGLDFIAFKFFCALFLVLSIPILYLLFKGVLKDQYFATIGVVIISLHPSLIIFSDEVQSDLPFLFFSLLALVYMRISSSWKTQILLGSIIFMAYWIRDLGVCLIPALICFQLYNMSKNGLTLPKPSQIFNELIPYLIFGGLFLLNRAVFPNGGVNHLELFIQNLSWDLVGENFHYYLTLWLSFLHLARNWPAIFIILSAMLVGIFYVAKINPFIVLYGLLIVIITIIWPFQQGIRLLIPVIPVALLLLFAGFKQVFNWMKLSPMVSNVILSLTVLVISVVNIRTVIPYFNRDSNQAVTAEMLSIYSFVKKLPEGSEIVFAKPRVLRLFTGQNSYAIGVDEFFTSNANYLLMGKGEDYENYNIVYETDNFILIEK